MRIDKRLKLVIEVSPVSSGGARKIIHLHQLDCIKGVLQIKYCDSLSLYFRIVSLSIRISYSYKRKKSIILKKMNIRDYENEKNKL